MCSLQNLLIEPQIITEIRIKPFAINTYPYLLYKLLDLSLYRFRRLRRLHLGAIATKELFTYSALMLSCKDCELLQA